MVFPPKRLILAFCLIPAVLIACGSPRVQVHPSPSTARVNVNASMASPVLHGNRIRGGLPDGLARPRDAVTFSLRAASNVERVLDAAVVIQAAKDAVVSARAAVPGKNGLDASSSLPRTAASPAAVSIAAVPSSNGCAPDVAALVEQTFGADAGWWFQVVIPRESHCEPGAVNWREGCDTSGQTNSHAVGLVQICMPQHRAAFAAVGCSDWHDLVCYVKAWKYLVDTEGRRPWGG